VPPGRKLRGRGLLPGQSQSLPGIRELGRHAHPRYFVPGSVLGSIINDPVVTSKADRLRFESFSGCCGRTRHMACEFMFMNYYS